MGGRFGVGCPQFREATSSLTWGEIKAGIRAKVEHPFRVIKRQFGFAKVRY
jgi:transposase, IS5 family